MTGCRRNRRGFGWRSALVVSVLFALGTGCSVKKLAVNKVGNVLAAGGSSFARDNDPELIRDAAPFSLKLMESLLAESPKHPGLLLALNKGFTQYAFAFVQQDADRVREEDLDRSDALRDRAQRLYLRARDYGLRGLERRHAGMTNEIRSDVAAAMARLTKKDVPFVYWTALAWGGAISLGKDDPEMISYSMSRPEPIEEREAKARLHFDRAMELSGGHLASPLVAYAEAVSVQRQNRPEFQELLHRALAIDVDAHPDSRLENLIMQDRAKWLLARIDELFFQPAQP